MRRRPDHRCVEQSARRRRTRRAPASPRDVEPGGARPRHVGAAAHARRARPDRTAGRRRRARRARGRSGAPIRPMRRALAWSSAACCRRSSCWPALQPAPAAAQHHPGRRRHGRPRVGPGLPARPPAPDGRLTGWTPDWYAGFPAYQFYMVVPSLLIVLLEAGLDGWAALVPALARHRRARQFVDFLYTTAHPLIGVACGFRRPRARGPALRHRLQARHGPRRRDPAGVRRTRSGGWPGCAFPGPRCSRWPRCRSCSTVLHDLRRQHPVDAGRRVRVLDLARLALLYLGRARGARHRPAPRWPRSCSPSPACAT